MMAIADRNLFNSSKHYVFVTIFESTRICIFKDPGHRSKVQGAYVKVACLIRLYNFGLYNFLRILHNFGDRAKVTGQRTKSHMSKLLV